MRFAFEDLDNKKVTKFVSIATIVVAVVVFSLFARQHKRQAHSFEVATSAIESLYLDKEHTYLKPGISHDQIHDVRAKVGGVSGVQGKQLHDLIDSAEEKYDAMASLSDLYQGEEPLIVGESLQEGHALKEDVTPQVVQRLKEELPKDEADELLREIDQQYDQILTTFSELEQSDARIDELADTVDVDLLPEQIQAYIEVEDELLKNQLHPQTKPIIEKYQQKCRQYGETLKEQAAYIEPDSPIVKEIFSSPSLSAPLTGSEIDPRPLVALTFDDGPTENTLEILEILDEYNVPATFFLLGRSVEAHPEIARAVVDAGHQVGNHSYSHPNFDLLRMEDIAYEIDITQEIIKEATGVVPTMYRSPYGNGRQQMMKLYPEMDPIYWNVDSEDWLSKDSVITVEHIAQHLEQRSIILMHDTQLSTTEAIKELIPKLKEQGYIFVSPTQIPEADSYRL